LPWPHQSPAIDIGLADLVLQGGQVFLLSLLDRLLQHGPHRVPLLPVVQGKDILVVVAAHIVNSTGDPDLLLPARHTFTLLKNMKVKGLMDWVISVKQSEVGISTGKS
jgi:hypothetical protein